MSRPRHRVRRLTLIVCGLLLLLTYAPTHRWEDEYLVFERDASGAMVRNGDGEFALGVRIALGRAESVGLEWRTSAPPSAGKVAARRVWFLNVSGERLLRETALDLQSSLKELDCVQETAYFPRTYQPLHESTLPDIFVTLELVDSKELHAPLYHRFEYTVQIGIGRRPLRSGSDPVSFRSAAHVELFVTVSGSEYGLTSAARKYDQAVAALSREVDLTGKLVEWRARFGAIEGAPEELIEAERKLPDLPLPPNAKRRQLYQGGYFLVHTEAMWTQPRGKDVVSELETLEESFQDAGWELVEDAVWGDASNESLKVALTHGPLYFEAFQVPGGENSLILYLQSRYAPMEARALFERCLALQRSSPGADPTRARLFLEHVPPSLRTGLLAALRSGPNPLVLEDEWVRILSR